MSSTLVQHYNAKYGRDLAANVTAVPICKYPRDRFEMAVSLALQHRGGRLLEVGAGNGRCALTLAAHFAELVLTELADVRFATLQDLFALEPNVTVVKNDLETQPLPYENYFETVLLVDVIEHFIDPISAVKKIHHAMRKGGRLIIGTPNFAKWTRRLKLAAGRFPSTASRDEGLLMYDGRTPTDLYDEGHLHYFTYRSLRRICTERVGFSRVEKVGYGRSWLNRAWPTMFSEGAMIAYK